MALCSPQNVSYVFDPSKITGLWEGLGVFPSKRENTPFQRLISVSLAFCSYNRRSEAQCKDHVKTGLTRILLYATLVSKSKTAANPHREYDLSDIKNEVYATVLAKDTTFTLNDIVKEVGSYRQAVEYHVKSLLEAGALTKPTYGKYVVSDRQVILDFMTFEPESKLRDELLLNPNFVKWMENLHTLSRYVGARELPLMSRDIRKKVNRELKAAERSIKAARAQIARTESMTKRQVKEFEERQKDGITEEIVETYEKVFGKFVKEHDWKDRVK